MEHQSHSSRELRVVDPEWTTAELMARIAKSLVSDGPALSLSTSAHTVVDPRIAVVVTTTGSSGVAKEVGLSASALLSSARASNSAIGAEFGNTWSLLLPLNHVAGINVLIRSLELGTIPADLRKIQGPLPKVDYTAIVPTQLFKALYEDRDLLAHLQSAKAVLVGGAALTKTLRDEARTQSINIVETYGSTETCGGCIYDGVPLAGVEVQIIEGALQIRGKTLAHSYLNSDLHLLDSDGWYHTSDLARDVNGKIIIEGRADDVVISGGNNVSLIHIENILNAAFAHDEIAATSRIDAKWGDAIVICTTNQNLSQEILQSGLGDIAFISSVIYLDKIPTIGIGKVDRAQLKRIAMEA